MFNAKEETEKIIEFIKDYYTSNNLLGAVIGISGGKDSAVVAGLLSKAIGAENSMGNGHKNTNVLKVSISLERLWYLV